MRWLELLKILLYTLEDLGYTNSSCSMPVTEITVIHQIISRDLDETKRQLFDYKQRIIPWLTPF